MGRGMQGEVISISPPNFQVIKVKIIGTSPLVINAFSAKARQQMKEVQEGGDKAKRKGKFREPKNFDECYEQARHVSEKGWDGIPASAFRCAMISACKTLKGLAMTKAKLAFFVEADGFDKGDGTPLVKITKGKPEKAEHRVRLETGVPDIRIRPMWRDGWEAELNIRFDNDMLDRADIVNLLARAGMQVGICEGRPDSKKSAGMGWGTFRIEGKAVAE
jgi:hypothetical protein